MGFFQPPEISDRLFNVWFVGGGVLFSWFGLGFFFIFCFPY